ncbi:MAG: Fe-S protein assembly co-chaperone HscB [Holosporaceae bacterium]|jgi:molecular chaperone HscB|nr:Fe-S protein assembly co-chaperone HscB [Holosporaceae bacterium]
MNYFDLFQIPFSYRLDEPLLTQNYLQKQRETHPDLSNMRASQMRSALLNEAYNTLLDPIRRAKYFLYMQKPEAEDEISPEYASEAFDIRERYDSITSLKEKEKYKEELSARMSELITSLCAVEKNIDEFQKIFSLLNFIASFIEEIKADAYNRD